MGIGWVANWRGFLVSRGRSTRLGAAIEGLLEGKRLGDFGSWGDLGGLACFGEITEGFRANGGGLEGSSAFAIPEKVAGEVGFGDLISGFGHCGLAVTGEGVRVLYSWGDFWGPGGRGDLCVALVDDLIRSDPSLSSLAGIARFCSN
jgi:hypothetical protein